MSASANWATVQYHLLRNDAKQKIVATILNRQVSKIKRRTARIGTDEEAEAGAHPSILEISEIGTLANRTTTKKKADMTPKFQKAKI